VRFYVRPFATPGFRILRGSLGVLQLACEGRVGVCDHCIRSLIGTRTDDSSVFQAKEKLDEVEASSTMNGELSSSVSGDLGFADTILGLGPPMSNVDPEIAPHTPAVPEGHFNGIIPPLANEATPDLSWPHDLNGSGEG
jgi:hypothetical protein